MRDVCGLFWEVFSRFSTIFYVGRGKGVGSVITVIVGFLGEGLFFGVVRS